MCPTRVLAGLSSSTSALSALCLKDLLGLLCVDQKFGQSAQHNCILELGQLWARTACAATTAAVTAS